MKLQLGIAKVPQLVGTPLNIVEAYGGKTAGFVDLHRLKANSPVPYHIPEAYAVPPKTYSSFSKQDLKQTFDQLASGVAGKSVIMARSSDLAENLLPGANSSFHVLVDPKDLAGSYNRFQKKVDELRSTSSTMGVLLNRMVGEEKLISEDWEDDLETIGHSNLSFIADTHNPVNPLEVFIALCHGLGTGVVDASNENIKIAALRESGLLTYFGNRSLKACLSESASITHVNNMEEYAQQRLEYIDSITGEVKEASMSRSLNTRLTSGIIKHGILKASRFVRRRLNSKEVNSSHDARVPSNQTLGFIPFNDSQSLTNLISILQYLGQNQAAQIEGAFASPTEKIPYLYQFLPIPVIERTQQILEIKDSDLESNYVIGSCNYEGPVLVIPSLPMCMSHLAGEHLRKFDEKYKDKGYAIVSSDQNRELIENTPHCRVRLSCSYENSASHPVTVMRMLMSRYPNKGYAFGMHFDFKLPQALIDKTENKTMAPLNGMVLNQVRIQSNGTKLVLKVSD